jgi:hypothetical protein
MLSERVALYHMRNGSDRESNPLPEATGADVNFEHRFYHFATRTAHTDVPA